MGRPSSSSSSSTPPPSSSSSSTPTPAPAAPAETTTSTGSSATPASSPPTKDTGATAEAVAGNQETAGATPTPPPDIPVPADKNDSAAKSSTPGAPAIITNSREVDALHEKVRMLEGTLAETRSSLMDTQDTLRDAMEEIRASRAARNGNTASPTLNPSSSQGIVTQVTNKRPGPLDIPLPGGGTVTLAPGVNMVPYEQWERAKKHPTVRHLLTQAFMPGAVDALVENGLGDTLDTQSPIEAAATIQSSADPEQLERWLTSERRPELRMAIQQRLGQVRRGVEDFQEKLQSAREQGLTHRK